MSSTSLSTLPLKRPRSLTPDISGVLPSHDTALAQKRPRLDETTSFPQTPCPLEQLPAEILQQIFFGALNGNLIRASPRIAAKLSDQAVYRTAFLVAFYHQSLVELHELYAYLLPEVVTKIPYWELRSMVKIVLDSKWCTWGWFRGLYFELMDDAVTRFQRLATKKISETSVEMISSLKERSMKLADLSNRGLQGRDKDDRLVELDCNPFDICLQTYPLDSMLSDDDDDDDDDDNDNGRKEAEATHWWLHLFAFGTIPMDASIPRGDDADQRPFRADFNQEFGLYGSYGPGFPSDLWDCLEGRILGAVRQHHIPKLRKRLQIDYFFHPEDMPYKIPARLFHAAVTNELWEDISEPGISVLSILFELDPYSLPRNSKIMKTWARETFLRICEEAEDQRDLLSEMRRMQTGPRAVSPDFLRRYVKMRRVQAHQHETDRAIVRYMRDGVVKKPPNLLSPSFEAHDFDDDPQTFVTELEERRSYWGEDHYREMTVRQLRDELSSRGVRPSTVGTRKVHYIERLVAEDREGNTHYMWWDDDCSFGDPDLDSLASFVRSLGYEENYEELADIPPPLLRGQNEQEDIMATENSEEGLQVFASPFQNPNLDRSLMLLEKYDLHLDRKEDYEWFIDP